MRVNYTKRLKLVSSLLLTSMFCLRDLNERKLLLFVILQTDSDDIITEFSNKRFMEHNSEKQKKMKNSIRLRCM